MVENGHSTINFPYWCAVKHADSVSDIPIEHVYLGYTETLSGKELLLPFSDHQAALPWLC